MSEEQEPHSAKLGSMKIAQRRWVGFGHRAVSPSEAATATFEGVNFYTRCGADPLGDVSNHKVQILVDCNGQTNQD